MSRFTPLGDLRIATLSAKAWGLGTPPTPDETGSGDEVRPETVAELRRTVGNSAVKSISRCNALARLGDIANRLGLHEQSIRHYREALENVGDDASAIRLRYNIAKILQQSGRLEEAVDEYTRLLANEPDPELRIMVHVNRSGAFLFLGRLEEAAQEATRVVQDVDAPALQKTKALMNRSSALLRANPAQALSDIDTCLGSGLLGDEEDMALRFNRIDLLRRLSDPNAAWSQLRELEADERLADPLKERLARLKLSWLRPLARQSGAEG